MQTFGQFMEQKYLVTKYRGKQLDQRTLSELIGKSQGSLSRYFKGATVPVPEETAKNLIRILCKKISDKRYALRLWELEQGQFLAETRTKKARSSTVRTLESDAKYNSRIEFPVFSWENAKKEGMQISFKAVMTFSLLNEPIFVLDSSEGFLFDSRNRFYTGKRDPEHPYISGEKARGLYVLFCRAMKLDPFALLDFLKERINESDHFELLLHADEKEKVVFAPQQILEYWELRLQDALRKIEQNQETNIFHQVFDEIKDLRRSTMTLDEIRKRLLDKAAERNVAMIERDHAFISEVFHSVFVSLKKYPELESSPIETRLIREMLAYGANKFRGDRYDSQMNIVEWTIVEISKMRKEAESATRVKEKLLLALNELRSNIAGKQ